MKELTLSILTTHFPFSINICNLISKEFVAGWSRGVQFPVRQLHFSQPRLQICSLILPTSCSVGAELLSSGVKRPVLSSAYSENAWMFPYTPHRSPCFGAHIKRKFTFRRFIIVLYKCYEIYVFSKKLDCRWMWSKLTQKSVNQMVNNCMLLKGISDLFPWLH